jgi:hypothetical protein
MKYTFVVSALVLLIVANLLMFLQFADLTGFGEGFQNAVAAAMPPSNAPPAGMMPPPNALPNNKMAPPMNMAAAAAPNATLTEGFSSYLLENSAGSKDNYQPMGAYDGVQLKTGNTTSTWRYTAPNEKLMGDEFVPGPDSLFMFKNNQCKPECCGASFSCGGGCVCTTPEQRQMLAGRGGNQTAPGDNP